ncbi:MAG TPA: YbjN domain-containing protein [Chitinophagales bacterium]|jgi:hypothetical protein|nr:YbjN domain-containing protein [Chitinophagales bacterium]MBP6155085.1 YbjN domain-containing protein [Chitinophagales bacterium]HQV79049.1 YbjN domain-containing protein [Chitinophagales bacterium]HQW79828.1 YbjN domain-containing protein [Chitinophagales bacterium]HRB68311.1 YbjN domain-containing protein [Chitinophagales bacterium]
MTELEIGISKVEGAIKKMNIDPNLCKGDKVGQYNMVHGSVNVWIDVWHIERENRAYFQVMSPIMNLANVTDKLGLFEELLKLNDSFYNVAFTMYDNSIWLKSIREVHGLDEDEVVAQIRRIGNYGDQHDDVLKQKYDTTYVAPSIDRTAGSPPQ